MTEMLVFEMLPLFTCRARLSAVEVICDSISNESLLCTSLIVPAAPIVVLNRMSSIASPTFWPSIVQVIVVIPVPLSRDTFDGVFEAEPVM